VEVAHEALLREWPRLRAWLEEDRGAIVAAGQIRDAAEDWKALDRDPGALYRGARLETVLSQVEAREDALPATTREFLAASRAARDEEARREAERVTRQARANRRLRLQLVALAVALVIALVGACSPSTSSSERRMSRAWRSPASWRPRPRPTPRTTPS
jgi:hypothetical protein